MKKFFLLYLFSSIQFVALSQPSGDLSMDPNGWYGCGASWPFSYGPYNLVPNGNLNGVVSNSVGSCDGRFPFGFDGMHWAGSGNPNMYGPCSWGSWFTQRFQYSANYYCNIADPGNPYATVRAVNSNITLGALLLRTYYKQTGIPNFREYMLVKLVRPLTEGKSYILRFTVAFAWRYPDSAHVQMDRLGVCLLQTDSALYNHAGDNEEIHNMVPAVETDSGMLVNDTGITFHQSIIGHGEQYLLVGCFRPQHSLTFSDTSQATYSALYIFDNFAIYGDSCATPYYLLPNIIHNPFCLGDTISLSANGNAQAHYSWYANGALLPDTTMSIHHVPTGDVVYSIATGTGGCYDTISVAVHSKYVGTGLPRDTALFCRDTITLNVVWHTNVSIYNYEWRNASGQVIASQTLQLRVSQPGDYIFACHDLSSCQFSDTVTVHPAPLLSDTNSAGATVPVHRHRDVSCPGLNDGFSQYSFPSYPLPLHFQWQPLNDTADGIFSLTSGVYNLRVWDDQRACKLFTDTIIDRTDSCAIVTGTVINDVNRNCIYDSLADSTFSNVVIESFPYHRFAISDSAGHYSMFIPRGVCAIQQVNFNNPERNVECLSSLTANASFPTQVLSNYNFYDTTYRHFCEPELVYISCNHLVPGTIGEYEFAIHNNGNLTSAGTAYFVLNDTLIHITNTAGAVLNGDTLSWSFSLDPGLSAVNDIVFETPPDPALVGRHLQSCGWIEPVNGDTNLFNNNYCDNRMVFASYDPNEKFVNPPGDGTQGLIDTTIRNFIYTINFQNTGTAPAANIVIEDTISPFLDLSTLKILGSSHSVQTDILNNRRILFRFLSIHLPDSSDNEPASHGWLMYKMRRNAGTYGDVISNTAHIYFDFNQPVQTNTVLNTLTFPATIPQMNDRSMAFSVFPNPAIRELLLISANPGNCVVRLYDLSGRLALESAFYMSGSHRLDIRTLNAGAYLLDISSESNLYYRNKILIGNN